MKQTLYINILFFFIAILPISIFAQDDCNAISIKTNVTESTCQSNGIIEVLLEGQDLSYLSDILYSIEGPRNVVDKTGNVFIDLPPGTYKVIVKAFCNKSATPSPVEITKDGIRVTGNYTVPVISFNPNNSRASYDFCPTGAIAVTVEGGNSSNFVFTITEAPSGVNTPLTVGASRNGNNFTLDGNYPAGNYKVTVDDGCYTAARELTLDSFSDMPEIRGQIKSSTDCSTLIYHPSDPIYTKRELKKHVSAGFFEIALTKIGETPTDWHEWRGEYTSTADLNIDISPSTLSDFYSNGTDTYTVHLRMKGCSAFPVMTKNDYIRLPGFDQYLAGYLCNTLLHFYQISDSPGPFCTPVTYKIYDYTTDTEVYSKANLKASDYDYVELNSGIYYAEITDNSGYKIKSSIMNYRTSFNKSFDIYYDKHCTTYNISDIYLNGATDCYPIEMEIRDESNTLVGTGIMNSASDLKLLNMYDLAYNHNYILKYTFPNTNPVESYTQTINQQAVELPTAYQITEKRPDNCTINSGKLTLMPTDGKAFPFGTIFKLEGPSGFNTWTKTMDYNGTLMVIPSNSSDLFLPPGAYKLTVDHGCGSPVVQNFTLDGFYDVEDFQVNLVEACDGLRIYPSGKLSLYGVTQAEAYFRISSGASGGYNSSITVEEGGFLKVTKPGNYEVGILSFNSSSGCVLKKIRVQYIPQSFELDVSKTAAYMCTGSPQGYMSLMAKGGVGPYEYSLWDAAGTTQIMSVPTQTLPAGTIAEFHYGNIGETYTIKVKDACGNEFPQPLTIDDLSSARIAWADSNIICLNGTLKLFALGLGDVTYEWTGPNGFFSNEQNPEINNITNANVGVYQLVIDPLCGVRSQPYNVTIQLAAPLVAGSMTADQVVCVDEAPATISTSATGGIGNYTYMWESSTDNSTWTDTGVTSADFTPPTQTTPGNVYYRRITYDTCESVTSSVSIVTFDRCQPLTIPVNPHLRIKTKQ